IRSHPRRRRRPGGTCRSPRCPRSPAPKRPGKPTTGPNAASVPTCKTALPQPSPDRPAASRALTAWRTMVFTIRRPRRAAVCAALVAVPLLLVAACSSGGSSGAAQSGTAAAAGAASGSCPYTFAFITHGDNGSFWSVVYKGAKDAAAAYGCKLSEVYGSQQQG